MESHRPDQGSPRVLVVDDERPQAELLAKVLALEGFDVACAFSPEEALRHLATAPVDAVVSDFRMPGMTGIELFREMRRRGHGQIFVIVTAFGTLETAVDAMREGAHDFVTKPVDSALLTVRLRRALRTEKVETENRGLRQAVLALKDGLRIVGESARMKAILQTIFQVALSPATVLLRGESGTGKELLARAIHLQSPRSHGPYVKLNCAAIPENLLEDELFGHAKGAFTGAIAERKGRFELAHGGTIFLDEIGDLPLHLQPKLLRVLQEREIEPIGSTRNTKIDVRVIAATHRDLKGMTAAGTFREDLFYRLNVIPVVIPAIRERREDILPLARFFLARFAEENQRRIGGFSKAAEERLLAYSWPGNVREIENCVERAVVLARGEVLDADEVLPANEPAPTDQTVGKLLDSMFDSNLSLDRLEREIIMLALDRCGGNLSRAARRLGMTRRSLQYRVEKIRSGGGDVTDDGKDLAPSSPEDA